jgi:hypothetical protein
MVSASLFATLLMIGTLVQAPASGPAPTSEPAPASDDYATALARVRDTQTIANEDPQLGATQLRDALQLLQGHGLELAKDPEGQRVRTMAQLTLSRALLAIEDAEGARAVMDEAIRTSRGDPLPTEEFGPGLAAMHREREGVLSKAGSGTIEVDCKQPCRVYINERPTDPHTAGLVLGRYRVWVESSDGSTRPLQTSVALDTPGQTMTVVFGEPPDEPVPDEPEPKTKTERIMPRGAEVALLVIGVAAIGTGAALWAIDERCPNGLADPRTTPCPQVYVTKTAGITTLALGGALGLLGGITLGVDEVRVGKQRAAQVALGWTLRF